MKTYHLLNGCLFPYHLALSQDLLPAPDPNMLQESESHIVSGKRKLILPKNSQTLKMHTGTKLNNRCENGTKGIISWRTICNVRANQMHCCGQVTVENSIPLTVFWNMDPKFTWFDQGEMETFPWPKTEEGTIVGKQECWRKHNSLQLPYSTMEPRPHPFHQRIWICGEWEITSQKSSEFSDYLL